MEKILNKKLHDFSKPIDVFQTVLIYLIALLVPTFLGSFIKTTFGGSSVMAANSQLIVGSIVNCALIISAINLNGWAKILGVVTMPSISTILSGYVFQTASPYMAWMIPAIWIGNFVLVYAFKFIMLSKNKNYFLAGALGILVKVLVIAASFMLLKAFNIFPEKLVSNLQVAMTSTQLITASIGCAVSFIIYGVEKNVLKKYYQYCLFIFVALHNFVSVL